LQQHVKNKRREFLTDEEWVKKDAKSVASFVKSVNYSVSFKGFI